MKRASTAAWSRLGRHGVVHPPRHQARFVADRGVAERPARLGTGPLTIRGGYAAVLVRRVAAYEEAYPEQVAPGSPPARSPAAR